MNKNNDSKVNQMNDYSEKAATMNRAVTLLCRDLEDKKWEDAAKRAAYIGADAMQIYQWVIENTEKK